MSNTLQPLPIPTGVTRYASTDVPAAVTLKPDTTAVLEISRAEEVFHKGNVERPALALRGFTVIKATDIDGNEVPRGTKIGGYVWLGMFPELDFSYRDLLRAIGFDIYGIPKQKNQEGEEVTPLPRFRAVHRDADPAGIIGHRFVARIAENKYTDANGNQRVGWTIGRFIVHPSVEAAEKARAEAGTAQPHNESFELA